MIIKTYNTAQETAQAVAREIFVAGTAQGALHIAISGGSTPRMLFEMMSQEPLRGQICWEHIHLYWVDERCVAPDDPQSNYHMTYEALLRYGLIPEAQIYRIRGEADPEAEAVRYTELVRSLLPSREGLPVFDVVLLGIGDDGHTSSIFPHQMSLLETSTPYAVAVSPTGQPRVCMTGGTILNARRIALHAVGAGKREVLSSIAHLSEGSEQYPTTYIARHAPEAELFTDQAL